VRGREKLPDVGGNKEKFAQKVAKVREEHAQCNKLPAGDMGAFCKYQNESQTRLARDVGIMKQQLSLTQSNPDKKTAHLSAQVEQAQQEVGNFWKQLREQSEVERSNEADWPTFSAYFGAAGRALLAPDGEVRRQCPRQRWLQITASSVSSSCAPRNGADLGGKKSEICSGHEPGEWICWNFKALRIEPTHDTIRTYNARSTGDHLKSRTAEASDDGASRTEMDRRENNSERNDSLAVKMFVVSRFWSFRRIRLRQTGPNHHNNNDLRLIAFEVFRAVPGLQYTVQGNDFFATPGRPAPPVIALSAPKQ
jgi:hypothetical protein